MTEVQLARLASKGDRAAFDEIVTRFCGPLTQFTWSKTSNLDDAEDLVQETFLRAHGAIGSFDGNYSLRTWLFTIAYRLTVSHYRKKRPVRLSPEAASGLPAKRNDENLNEWVWEAARELKPQMFDVLWLYYKQGMDTRQIADIMNKTSLAVRVLLHRSRKKLAQRIHILETNEKKKWHHHPEVIMEGTK